MPNTDFAFRMMLPLICILTAGCHRQPAQEIPRYEPEQAQQADAAQFVRLPSEFDASKEVATTAATMIAVSTPVSGRVTRVSAFPGDKVTAGQVLFEVASQEAADVQADLFKELGQVRADLAEELLQLRFKAQEAATKVDFTKRQLERCEKLLAERIGSRAQYEAAKAEHDSAQVNQDAITERKPQLEALSRRKEGLLRQSARQRLRLFGMSDSQIGRIFKSEEVDPLVPVISAQPGIVLERKVNPGQLINTSSTAFLIDDMDQVWLVADVYERDIDRVTIGQKVQFTVDSFPHQRFEGKLSYVASVIDPETRTLRVRAVVPNQRLLLKPKMFARMDIFCGDRSCITVPKSALLKCDTKHVVYVARGPRSFEQRIVTTGAEWGDSIEIVRGLSPSEQVVSTGGFTLRACSLAQTE
jgi:membrane fusion protein, heavy metal efflux system